MSVEHSLRAVATALGHDEGDLTPPYQSPEQYAPPSVRNANEVPSYVTPEETNRVGALAGAALVNEYERVAKTIEELGRELRTSVEAATAMLGTYTNAMKELDETARAYREEGKRIYHEIQRTARLADDAAKTAVAMRQRILSDEEASPLIAEK